MMDVNDHPIINKLISTIKKPSWAFPLLLFTLFLILSLQFTNSQPGLLTRPVSDVGIRFGSGLCDGSGWVPERALKMSIVEFGGVGDGVTSNTAAFRAAVRRMEGVEGGAQLNVPRGTWVTGSFNVTSYFTLFLEDGAVILGSQDPEEWPIIKLLPSYGGGIERLGGRHMSLIHGDGLKNVVITGQNGTIDGRGKMWSDKMWWDLDLWWNRTLEHTFPTTGGHLVEIMNSYDILISNLTFRNSPFWTIRRTVYCWERF